MLGKPMSKPHPPKDPSFRAERPLQLVHADLAGPIKPASWGGGVEYSAISTAIFLTEPDPGQPRTVLCSLTADMKTFTKMIHDNNEVHRMNYLYSYADAYKYHNEKLC